jgi:hypothetical protein
LSSETTLPLPLELEHGSHDDWFCGFGLESVDGEPGSAYGNLLATKRNLCMSFLSGLVSNSG